jgi:serine/threonine-protein kinase
VFRAVAEFDDGHSQDVALTRLVPSLTKNQKFVAMLLDDMRAALSLHGSNIVQVVDIARTPEDEYFVVAEYVDGCDLRTFSSRRNRIALQHVLQVAVQCCKGLAHAHSLGVIHRNLSPRAILLGTKGEVKLVDFGLAKANSQLESSDPGVAKEKFSYLSPEAASGREVDHRVDIFAAGIVLWELLAGRRLFVGPTDYQTVELIRAGRIPTIDGLDPVLDTIVRKALARDHAERHQSATELGAALAQYAASRGIELASSETAKLVRDVKFEVDYERSAKPIDRAALVQVQDRANRMVSILEGQSGQGGPWN